MKIIADRPRGTHRLTRARRLQLAYQTDLCQQIASQCFAGKTDLHGEPLIAHTLQVVQGVREIDRPGAWLHDVKEDAGVAEAEMLHRGIDATTVRTVTLLTRDPAVTYHQYICAIVEADGEEGASARRIKVVDMNVNLRRAPHPRITGLRARYLKEREFLVTEMIARREITGIELAMWAS